MGRLRHDMHEEEKRALEEMISERREIPANTKVIERGQTCNTSTLLIDGFMLRTIEAGDRRYVVSFHVPGDFVDMHCFTLKRLDHNIVTVGPATIGQVSHQAVYDTMDNRTHLARLFWFSTLLDAAMHREWIMKLEQLTANRRIAHIFCEIWTRLEMVGLGRPDGFDTPLTQADIADMCGSTTIHANRAIGELRKLEVVDFRRGKVRVPDREKLFRFAHFSADYLYGSGTLSLEREGGPG